MYSLSLNTPCSSQWYSENVICFWLNEFQINAVYLENLCNVYCQIKGNDIFYEKVLENLTNVPKYNNIGNYFFCSYTGSSFSPFIPILNFTAGSYAKRTSCTYWNKTPKNPLHKTPKEEYADSRNGELDRDNSQKLYRQNTRH